MLAGNGHKLMSLSGRAGFGSGGGKGRVRGGQRDDKEEGGEMVSFP